MLTSVAAMSADDWKHAEWAASVGADFVVFLSCDLLARLTSRNYYAPDNPLHEWLPRLKSGGT